MSKSGKASELFEANEGCDGRPDYGPIEIRQFFLATALNDIRESVPTLYREVMNSPSRSELRAEKSRQKGLK